MPSFTAISAIIFLAIAKGREGLLLKIYLARYISFAGKDFHANTSLNSTGH